MTSSFWKNSILTMFCVQVKTQNWRFQIPRVSRAFSFEKCPFLWLVIVDDGISNRRNKPADEM